MVLADTFYALWQESQAKVADLERQATMLLTACQSAYDYLDRYDQEFQAEASEVADHLYYAMQAANDETAQARELWTPMRKNSKVVGCEIYILEDNVIEVAGLEITLPDGYAVCQLKEPNHV